MKTQSKHEPNTPDTENPEWTDAMFAKAKRLSDLTEGLQAKLRAPGRPKAAVTKERISIRLSPDVLQGFRAEGPGWQTRMDAALREWLQARA
ncbi:MAG TPA: BrnA antitoxin family protein [Nevskiaceae bacterium]|nr:BrnA antitoxin family protein [Nevskiaceae bacterium]